MKKIEYCNVWHAIDLRWKSLLCIYVWYGSVGSLVSWNSLSIPYLEVTWGEPRGALEIVIQEVLWSIRGSYSVILSLPLMNVKCHSDPWPTVTSKPKYFPPISWPCYRDWPSPNYEWFSWSIYIGCGMPAGNASPSGHLVPSPHFWTFLYSNYWHQIPRPCHVFTRLFTLNAPWYFLEFAVNE